MNSANASKLSTPTLGATQFEDKKDLESKIDEFKLKLIKSL